MRKVNKVAIIGAFDSEIQEYKKKIVNGSWNGKEVFVFVSNVGKPSSAAITQKIISEYKPDCIIFTGVGGALEKDLEIGDIGIGVAAIDSEIDIRSRDKSYKRGEQPWTRKRIYLSNKDLAEIAFKTPLDVRIFSAYIASGSCFLDKEGKTDFIKRINPELETEIEGKVKIPNIYEMEGSAFLQVANDNNIPALLIRQICDTLEGDSPSEFYAFIENNIQHYVKIIDYILREI